MAHKKSKATENMSVGLTFYKGKTPYKMENNLFDEIIKEKLMEFWIQMKAKRF